MTFLLKIDYFQKQGDFSGNRETASKTENLPHKKGGLTAMRMQYTGSQTFCKQTNTHSVILPDKCISTSNSPYLKSDLNLIEFGPIS